MSDNGDNFVYCLKILSIIVSGFTPMIKVIYSTNILIHTQKCLSVTTMTNSKNSMREEFMNVIWFASCRFKYVKIKTQWFYLKSEKEHPRSKVCPLMSLGSCCFELGQSGQSLSLSLSLSLSVSLSFFVFVVTLSSANLATGPSSSSSTGAAWKTCVCHHCRYLCGNNLHA